MAKPINFIVIGDSAASGVGDSDSEGNYFGWGFHLAQAFKEPINYSNFARPGAQSREVRQIQLPRIIGENPDLVAVIVGGNDLLRNGFSPVEFEENLNFVLNEIESLGATSLLLELHDPTKLIPMPSLLRKVCTRRVELVNHITRRLAHRYGSILLETRSLPGIYERSKWHVDKMHPSRNGHQFIADVYAHLLRGRGYEVGHVDFTQGNNRSQKDSILWMLRNGTPWFFKRSFDLLPALVLLMAIEAYREIFSKSEIYTGTVLHQDFSQRPTPTIESQSA